MNPIPGHESDREDALPGHAGGQFGAELDRQPGRDQQAQRLANDQADDHPPGDAAGERVADAAGVEADSGIGQRKRRDDEIGDPGMQMMLQAVDVRYRLAAEIAEADQGFDDLIMAELALRRPSTSAEAIQQPARGANEPVERHRRPPGCEKSQHRAQRGRMDT